MSSKAPPYSELIHRAMDFAAKAHEGQFRKDRGEKIPYISHPAMVSRLLEGSGFDEGVVAAGILHDTVEDTEVTLETLKDRFGERVAALVEQVTEEDKSLPWEKRKARYLERLREAPFEALAVCCADKIHNLWSLILLHRAGGDAWDLLSRDRDAQLARFDKLAGLFDERFDHPLREAFDEALKTLRSECT